MTTELERAYDRCQSIARQHARNFYYAFRTLPSKKRRAIYATYAYCRACDDIADEQMPLEEKRRLFAETRERLEASRNGRVGDPVFLAVADAARAFSIPADYFEEVIQGVEMDLVQSRYRTWKDLRDYCYKVASVVGLICIEIFEYSDPRAHDYAVDLGLAMQLTNILRDVKEDAERGRIYIPLDDMATFGYSESELERGVVNDSFKRLMAFETDRARSYFESGKRLIPLLSSESRACPSVLHGLYSAVLDRIESSGYRVFDGRIGLSTAEKLLITARIWARGLIPSVPLPGR
jgi:phytoene synthase